MEAEVVRLALPAIAQSLVQTLVFVVHRLVLGRYDERALAAMQIGSALLWTLTALSGALAPATVAIVGRSVGAGALRDARAAARAALVLALASGVAIAALGPVLVGPILRLLYPTVEPLVAASARRYLLIVLLGQPALLVATMAASALQGAGDTRTPMRAAAIAQVVNGVLCVGLVFGVGPLPELGIAGAAWASVVAFAIEAAVLLAALVRRSGPALLGAAASPLPAAMVRLLRLSAATFGERLIYHAGMNAFFALLARLGTDAMAANQALISIESVSFLSADGFGIAAAAIVALRLGAARPQEAEAGARAATRLAVLCLSAFGAAFAIVRGPLLGAFAERHGIRAMGEHALLVGALAQPFMAIAIVRADALRGAGDNLTVLAVALAGAVVVRIAATAVFTIAIPLGLTGVWMGSGVDWLFRAALLTWIFRRGRWKTRRV